MHRTVTERLGLWTGIFAATAGLGCGSSGSSHTVTPDAAAPVTLKMLAIIDKPVGGLIQASALSFTQQSGIQTNVVLEPDFNNLMPTAQRLATAGSSEYDVVLLLNIWTADLVNLGFIEPLDRFITRDAADPMLAWDDVPDGVKQKNNWGGHTYSMLVDNDTHFLHYRKDVLGDPKWQAAFKADVVNNPQGIDLPNPPSTLEETMMVAKFFTHKDWNGDGKPEEKWGFVQPTVAGSMPYAYAINWIAPYATMPRASANVQALLHFDLQMKSLANLPGYQEGVRMWDEMNKCCVDVGKVGGVNRQDVITYMVNGKAAMAFDWGDIAAALMRPGATVPQSAMGFAPTPGSSRYYDRTTGQWVATASVRRVPYEQSNGWALFLTSTSLHKEEAWQYIRFASSPQQSLSDVTSNLGGFQPWRTSHMNVAAWTAAGWDATAADGYIKAILGNVNDANALIDLRIPGTSDYYLALDNAVLSVAAGTQTIEAALSKCATEQEAVTTGLGREPQISAYKAHLGLP
jgi:multiple sugar transport system substrate-binding protein